VFKRILRRMQDKIRRRYYVMTHHASREMDEDELTIFDVECGILTGKIVERQRDPETKEIKYRIRGKTPKGVWIELIAKIGATGKLVIITVYVQ
jgi:hypothetical protein